jgi:hypothetical protein
MLAAIALSADVVYFSFIFMKSAFSRFSPFIVTSVLAGTVLLFSYTPRASAGVPTDVTTAVNDTNDVVKALGPIALTAISVSLIPFGAGMALKFVKGVMSH